MILMVTFVLVLAIDYSPTVGRLASVVCRTCARACGGHVRGRRESLATKVGSETCGATGCVARNHCVLHVLV